MFEQQLQKSNNRVVNPTDQTKVQEVEVSQMATYWFVIGWFDIQKAQKSKV